MCMKAAGLWVAGGQSNHKRLHYLHSTPHIAERPVSHHPYETIGEKNSKQNVRVYLCKNAILIFRTASVKNKSILRKQNNIGMI